MNTNHDDLLRNGIEIRAWSTPRIYSPRKPAPGALMRRLLAESIAASCSDIVGICARMETLRKSGQTRSLEFQRLRLDLAKAQGAIADAQAVETRAFGVTHETR